MREPEFYINELGLKKHPEGGWYKEVYRSVETIRKECLPERFTGNRYFSTSIYFLLTSDTFSAFHRIKSDEIWHFYDGDAIKIHMIDRSGNYSTLSLGKDIESGEVMQFTVPHSTWFAAEVGKPGSFALVGCTVAPGFDFDDFEIGEKDILLMEFPSSEYIINKYTR